MTPKEYLAFIKSPAGMLAIRDAAKILNTASPEEEDADLLERVKAVGLPQSAAVRVFRHVLHRYAPLTCRKCQKQFLPRAIRTIDWPWCFQCIKGPSTPEQDFKNRARALAAQALNSGKIKAAPCTVCGNQFAQMHHPDYSRPRHIVWLCAVCHAAEHKNLRVSRATV